VREAAGWQDSGVQWLFTSPLVIVFALGVTLLAIALPLWRMWVVYSGATSRRHFDASAAGLVPPRDLEPVISGLMRLGFRRLGEAQVDLPGVRAVEITATAQPRITGEDVTRHTVFVMVDSDGTVIAETGQVPGLKILVSLNSVFADSSVVETMYPRGESIHDADFHSGHNTESLDKAYDDQRVEMNRWRMRHGAPRVISTMADYLRADAEYRERFAQRKLRRPFIRRQVLPSAVIVAVILVLAVSMLLRWPA
jgi:hypothetical protein